MSNKKINRRNVLSDNTLAVIVCIISLVASQLLYSAEEPAEISEIDPVLEFFWNKAVKTYDSNDIESAKVHYSYNCKAIYNFFDSDGKLVKIDSMWATQYRTGSRLDSQIVIEGDASRFENLSLEWPNIFHLEYEKSFFPNDTGGVRLAIELVADSANPNQPDGLLILNRDKYHPLKIYFYYPKEENFRRLTREFSFVMVDRFLFVESIVEIGTRQGIWKKESYKMETSISNIKIISSE